MNVFGGDAGFFVYVNFVINHLALLRRLGIPNHCIHVAFGEEGGLGEVEEKSGEVVSPLGNRGLCVPLVT